MLAAGGLEAVQLVAGDIDDVARPDLVHVVTEHRPRATGLDHRAVVVEMLLRHICLPGSTWK